MIRKIVTVKQMAKAAFTKPPLFQRNGLTCRGNPLYESCVEGKAKKHCQVEVQKEYF
jgi:hypothetical protein